MIIKLTNYKTTAPDNKSLSLWLFFFAAALCMKVLKYLVLLFFLFIHDTKIWGQTKAKPLSDSQIAIPNRLNIKFGSSTKRQTNRSSDKLRQWRHGLGVKNMPTGHWARWTFGRGEKRLGTCHFGRICCIDIQFRCTFVFLIYKHSLYIYIQ
jgi:hypothetical protein